jgi:hypothetical protein
MRYFIGFLVTIGLIVLILFLLLRGGGSSTPAAKLLNIENYAYNSNATAEFIVDGPVVSDQDHREFKIDVTENTVTFTLYQGYEQNVLTTQTYSNNSSSFAVFLHALQLNGFTLGNNTKSLSDERGHCATSDRSIYSFSDGTNQLFRYWSSECGTGTFKGQANVIGSLFKLQVPNYNALIQGVNI